ncbi:MAG: fructosamine kinase family protein [Opitutae bacterium]
MSGIDRAISESTGCCFRTLSSLSIGGGCINQASKIAGEDGRVYFIKKNQSSFLPFFEAEAQALHEINQTDTVRAPQVIAHGLENGQAFLVLEFIDEGTTSSDGQTKLGTLLGKMHRVTQPYFGWTMDNCIGATPQPNPQSHDWISFYRDHRLSHQFALAAKKGREFSGSRELLDCLDTFFTSYHPHPSLLHGDLWGGNASQDRKGSPFIFDPASYYGDREADLAFTYMFGGFSSSFYTAYEREYPIDPGFRQRKTLYNLYHELNHFNLFGGGYASSAQASIDWLLQAA